MHRFTFLITYDLVSPEPCISAWQARHLAGKAPSDLAPHTLSQISGQRQVLNIMGATWIQTQFTALFQVLVEGKALESTFTLQEFTCPLCSIINMGFLAQVYDSITKEK